MEVKKLSHAVGAEVRGVDLRQPLSGDMAAAIRKAWLDHGFLLFRGQDITPAQHIAVSRCFGELEIHANRYNRHPDHPELFLVTNRMVDGKPSDTRNVGRQWHSDGAYSLRPPTGSLLHAVELPEAGGSTWFTNMYLAYETLSPTLRDLLEGGTIEALEAAMERLAGAKAVFVDVEADTCNIDAARIEWCTMRRIIDPACFVPARILAPIFPGEYAHEQAGFRRRTGGTATRIAWLRHHAPGAWLGVSGGPELRADAG